MNIAWLYLDKRTAAINALKDFESMNYIIENTQSEIASTQEGMTSLGSPALSDMPKGPHNPRAAENKIVQAMDTINLLNERISVLLSTCPGSTPLGLLCLKTSSLCSADSIWPMKAGKLTVSVRSASVSISNAHLHIKRKIVPLPDSLYCCMVNDMSKIADDFYPLPCYTGIVEREEFLQLQGLLFLDMV